MDFFMDFFIACLRAAIYGSILFLLLRAWKVLGLFMEVLNIFLARHKVLWDALNAIREQRNRENPSERESPTAEKRAS